MIIIIYEELLIISIVKNFLYEKFTLFDNFYEYGTTKELKMRDSN